MYIWDCKIAPVRASASSLLSAAVWRRVTEPLGRLKRSGLKAAPSSPAPEDAPAARSGEPGSEKRETIPRAEG